jgi:hypothetical protein
MGYVRPSVTTWPRVTDRRCVVVPVTGQSRPFACVGDDPVRREIDES